MRRSLREIAEPVRARARANVKHKTGRRGAGSPLEPSIRIGVTARAVSVYSNKPHAAVQDLGGRVGQGALITRASASAYMTKAVQESGADVETSLEHLGERIAYKFGGR